MTISAGAETEGHAVEGRSMSWMNSLRNGRAGYFPEGWGRAVDLVPVSPRVRSSAKSESGKSIMTLELNMDSNMPPNSPGNVENLPLNGGFGEEKGASHAEHRGNVSFPLKWGKPENVPPSHSSEVFGLFGRHRPCREGLSHSRLCVMAVSTWDESESEGDWTD